MHCIALENLIGLREKEPNHMLLTQRNLSADTKWCHVRMYAPWHVIYFLQLTTADVSVFVIVNYRVFK